MNGLELPLGIQLKHTKGSGLTHEELTGLSIIDNKVFCGAPWYEGDFCELCSGMKPAELPDPDSETCFTCGANVITLATRERKVSEELHEDLSYVAILKNGENLVIGYSFGYRFGSPAEFVASKYKTAETQAAVLTAMRTAGITDSFYYYSGMGIDQNYRGLGLSHFMGKAIDDYARSHNLPGLTRTLANSPIVKMREKLGFKIIVGPQIQPSADFENPNRVLMIRM